MSDSVVEQPRSGGGDVDILGSFEHLKEALFRYYNTPFGLADQRLEAERQGLFDVDGGAWRRPLLEVRPRYGTVDAGIAESVRSAGAHPDLAELVQLGLLQGVPSLYEHQHRALTAAVRDGRDVVVTAGTGSGKTESFMLPILADLVRESAAWPHGDTAVQPLVGDPRRRVPAAAGRGERSPGCRARSGPLPDERPRRRSDDAPAQGPRQR